MKITDLNLSKAYSYAEYSRWKFKEQTELINGKVFVNHASPAPVHQEITLKIALAMLNHVQHTPWKVYIAPFDVRIPRDSVKDKDIFTVVQPDICLVCDRSKLDENGCIGAPDIVVEILKPGNTEKELKYKYAVYEEAGVKEYWVVTPMLQSIFIYHQQNGQFQSYRPLVKGDIINTSLLPGFELDVTSIFRGMKPV